MGLIDGAVVNGSARLVGWVASVARAACRSGYLYHYAFAMIIGLAVLLALVPLATADVTRTMQSTGPS